jgi:hypothetical protein
MKRFFYSNIYIPNPPSKETALSKKAWSAAVLSGCLLALSYPVFSAGQLMNGTRLPFYVYHGFASPENHYAASGWMGDYSDLKYTDNFMSKADNKKVIRIEYTAKASKGAGWAGIYWQHPANNWGSREGGYNLNGAKRLTFRARGERGGEKINEFKIGGLEGDYRDSGSAAIGPVELGKKWQDYTIPLDGQELSSIAGGFCLTMAGNDNPNGAVVYLDDIRFE